MSVAASAKGNWQAEFASPDFGLPRALLRLNIFADELATSAVSGNVGSLKFLRKTSVSNISALPLEFWGTAIQKFTGDARMQADCLSDPKQAEMVIWILDLLDDECRAQKIAMDNRIHLVESDVSDSVYLEWIFPNLRVGFNIERDADESGWYILLQRPSGELDQEWGYMDQFNVEHIITKVSSTI